MPTYTDPTTGQRFSAAEELTPEELDAVFSSAAGGSFTTTAETQPPTADTLDKPRLAASGAGGVVGGALGGWPGAVMGAGLGSTAVDVYRGDADPARMVAQGLGAAALNASGVGAGASAARQVIGSGLAQTFAGQVYDFVKAATGHDRWPTLTEGATRAAHDFLGGVAGESLGRAGAANRAAKERRAAAGRQTVQENTDRYQRMGIESTASERLYGTPGSGSAAMAEGMAERFPIGRQAPAAMQSRREAQATGAARSRIDALSPRGVTTEIASANTLRPEVQAGFGRWEQMKNAAFEMTNAEAGPDPVVPMGPFRAALQSIASLGRRKPLGAPSFTGKMLKATEPVLDSMQVGVESNWPAFEQGLAESPLEWIDVILSTNDKIPFWLFRRMESELGNIAYRGAQPVGGITQADARFLYKALMQSGDEFYNTELGSRVSPLLQQAKDIYKQGRFLFNDTVTRQFLDDSTATPEQMFAAAFTPKQATNTQYVKSLVPEDVWDAAAQGWAEGIYQRATREVGGREVFSPAKFASEVARYDHNGQLELILGPERAADWRELAATYRQMRESQLPGYNPSSTTTQATAQGQVIGTPMAALSSLYAGRPDLAAGLMATGIGGPMALGQLVAREGGKRLITSALQPRGPVLSEPAASFLGALAGPGAGAQGSDFLRWLQAQGAQL